MQLIDIIISYSEKYDLTKNEHLVFGIIEAIDEGLLKREDQLPSINVMNEELGYARKTIVKAYDELKERGLVESRKTKGYFVVSSQTNTTKRVALLLYSFQRFQEEFYNSFRKELGKRFKIDVYFHHNNLSVFESTMESIMGKYGAYVIAPIQDPKVMHLLQKIDPKKLLIVDRYLELGRNNSYISQEFEESTYAKLIDLLPEIVKYDKFVLFFRDDSVHPEGILNAFKRFLSDYNIKGRVEKDYEKGSIKKDILYFFIHDTLLWEIIRDCKKKNFVLGKDVGILSYDDHVVKEIVGGGITTISSDFEDMGRRAANHVKYGNITKEIMPLNLIKRSSI